MAYSLTPDQINKIGTKLLTASPTGQAAGIKYLQENLSPENQAAILAQWSGSTAPSEPAPAAASAPLDTSIDLPAPVDVTQYGVDTADIPDITNDSGSTGSLNLSDEYDKLIADALAVNKDFLAGKISPQDLAQLESVSGEKSLAAGLGTGSASRNLTARDIGLTQQQLKQQGITNASTIGQMLEIKRQYNIGTSTAIAEYNKTFSLQQAQLQDQMNQTNLNAQQIQMQDDQFAQSLALEYNKLIVSMWQYTTDLTFKYKTTKGEGGDVDTSGLTEDSQAVIADLSSMIG